jgi:hypothetical protein
MAATRDKKLTKTQLKKMLNYLDVKGRAMVLFLASSGCRIGESLKLKQEDLELDSKPPKAHIRNQYTKNQTGGRTIYFSFEAADAIRAWLNIKADMKKKNGKKYNDNRVFGWSKWTARDIWIRAITKAKLDQKDTVTDRYIYHIHGLRKFFRSNINLDLDIVHVLMGHLEYLDQAYLRQNQSDIEKAYLEAMSNVNVFATVDLELKQETMKLKEENKELKDQMNALTTGLLLMEKQLEEQKRWREQGEKILDQKIATIKLGTGKLSAKTTTQREALRIDKIKNNFTK